MSAIVQRPPNKLRQTYMEAVTDAVALIEKALGGRKAILNTLSVAPPTPEMERVISAIADPVLADVPLAEICVRSEILPSQLLEAYQQAQQFKARLLALRVVADRVPDVTADIVRRSLPHDTICPRCDGTKQITVQARKKFGKPQPPPTIMDCYRCAGKGHIKVEAEESQQDRVLALAGLIEKGSGLSIINQTQINTGRVGIQMPGSGTLEAVQQAAAAILANRRTQLSDRPDVIDATVLPQGPLDGGI